MSTTRQPDERSHDRIVTRVVVRPPGGGPEHPVRIDTDVAVSVADVATALGDAATTDLAVEGRTVPGHTPLRDAGLRTGVTVAPLAAGAAPGPAAAVLLPAGPPADGVVELHVVGGRCSGHRVVLAPGTYTIGRERGADVVVPAPTVSARHARLTVAVDGACTIEDLGARNGVRIDGASLARPRRITPDQLVELGATQLRLRRLRSAPAAPRVPPAGTTTVPFNRPPREGAPPAPGPIALPPAPTTPTAAPSIGWTTVLVPLVVGAALALVVDPRLAILAALTPLLALGSAWEDRRRARRARAADRAGRSRAESELRTAVADAVDRLARAREAQHPDPAEVVARALTYDTRCWERRRDHADVLRLRIGTGTVELPVATTATVPPDPEAVALVDRARARGRAPVVVDLRPGHALGIVGGRDEALPALRWLVVAAAVHHGPADLRIAICTDRPAAWAWAGWLPHDREVVHGAAALTALMAELGATATPDDRVTLLVLDLTEPPPTLGSRLRELLEDGHAAACIAAVPDPTAVPAVCGEVVTLHGADGVACLRAPASGAEVPDLLLAGLDDELAPRVARALAGLDDPELDPVDGGLPTAVSLLHLLELDGPSPADLRRRWDLADGAPATPIGVDATGVVTLDLVRDGPHGLVGGTTGAGKSELLRTLVAGLAATTSPTRLNLVLIDYKGGAAFDACADLPHTVGLVTDLDDQLAARALTCLEAELRWRERRLREVGASDIAAAQASAPIPLPRLLVVIDELAALTAELPAFVEALVDIAQRGRSLGVHLLLATQRPSGIVSPAIRANTDLRIALRVQDDGDAVDLVGVRDAAGIPRELPGRAVVRSGSTAPRAMQVATVTGRSTAEPAPAVRVTEVDDAGIPVAAVPPDPGSDGGTELAHLVAACRVAAQDLPAPRRPWPDPLPDRVSLRELASAAAQPTVGLADEPDRQRQVPFTLDLDAGPVVLVGTPGSGPTDALVATALQLASTSRADDLHLHVLDLGTGLGALAGLPHVGAYVGPADRERQVRLLRLLSDELERRRAAGSRIDDRPRWVVLLDGYATFAQAFDDLATFRLREAFDRVVAEGSAIGITTVLTADRPAAVPGAIAATAGTTLAFRLPDPFDWAGYGIAADRVPTARPGRAVEIATAREVQVAVPEEESLPHAVAAIAATASLPTARPPRPVETLPAEVKLVDCRDPDVADGGPAADDGGWRLPVGRADDDLAVAYLRLAPGSHALVAGPARSGRSTALATLASTVAELGAEVALTVVAPRPSPVTDVRGAEVVDDLAALAARCATLAGNGRLHLAVVDDAELGDDPTGALHEVLQQRCGTLRVVVAGRNDALRAVHAPWLTEVRRSRLGLALRPDLAADGALWGTQLPHRIITRWTPGRAVLVHDDDHRLVQVALP